MASLTTGTNTMELQSRVIFLPRVFVNKGESERPIRISREDRSSPDRREGESDSHYYERSSASDVTEITVHPKKIAFWVGLALSIIALVVAVGSFAGSTVASQRELNAVSSDLDAFKAEVRGTFKEIDDDHNQSRAQRALISSLAKRECMKIADEGGGRREASIIGLSCDSLLPGVFDSRVRQQTR